MKSKQTGWKRSDWSALAASVVLHAVLAAVAIFGLPRWTTPLPPSAPTITGSLVESPTAARQARERAEQQAREEAERQAEAERQRLARIEAEKQARLEAERKERERVEAERVRKEQQRIAREKAEEQARIEAEAKAREAAAAKAREEAERKAREEAARKAKAEAERKARAEAERKARAEAERKARIAAENKAREDALASALAAEQDAMDRSNWSARLGAHIQKFWVRPAGAREDFSCIVRIRQSRYGDVLARSIVRTCGNDFLDNSVLEAVDEASPLPLPRNPRVFDELVDIEFVPF